MKNFGLTSFLLLLSACAEQRVGSESPEPPAGPAAPAAPARGATSAGADDLPALGVAEPAASEMDSGAVSEPPPARSPDPEGFTVHEWGTFTSVNGSTGTLMEGLHHEEEALPSFVYGRSRLGVPSTDLGAKALESLPTGVTQKLETPVLYFYGAARQGVRARVDFPTGVVSQWFPHETRFGPALGTVDVPRGGYMEWVFDMVPDATDRDFPAVNPDDVWVPSRRVASVPIAVGAERERFIFYRGLGAFELPLHMTIDASDRITIENRSTDASPALFLLRVHPGGGAIVPLGKLAGGGVLSDVPSPISGKERNLDAYVTDAQTQIAAALVQTGLYPDEARAMVDTWSKSYFQSEGLRILYVVPRAWTDKLLPLKVEPAPTELVRTLVGRVELLAPSEEQAILTRVSDATTHTLPPSGVISDLGRLAEPKLRRVLQLTSDAKVHAWTSQAITTAVSMP